MNVFQHAIELASFTYSILLLILYIALILCTLMVCNLLKSVLSDNIVDMIKTVVSLCANKVFRYFALQLSCEYLNESRENMRHYKNKTIKSIRLYYRRVPRKLLNYYNKITLHRLNHLYDDVISEFSKTEKLTATIPMIEYLKQNAEKLPFHCGLIFEMEDGVHLMLDKTSTMQLHKMNEPYLKNAVIKEVSLGEGNLKRTFTLGAFIDAGKRCMKDKHWFQWDTKHHCFYITRQLLVKNGLYSEEEHEMTRYYNQMSRIRDAYKTFSYSKNLDMLVQLQARTVACNISFVHKLNRIIMYSLT